jgi:hypothetical protein
MSTDVLFDFSRVASEADLRDRCHATLGGCIETALPDRPEKRQEPLRLAPALLEYLRLLLASPGRPATARDNLAGISAATGSRRRTELLKLGLIEEFVASPGGRGAAFKDIRLTGAGLRLLERS